MFRGLGVCGFRVQRFRGLGVWGFFGFGGLAVWGCGARGLGAWGFGGLGVWGFRGSGVLGLGPTVSFFSGTVLYSTPVGFYFRGWRLRIRGPNKGSWI